MEITPEVSNTLKCSQCSELLSCGPVYFLPATQNAICGRCDSTTENGNSNAEAFCNDRNMLKVRYIQYEAAASLLLFPCRYTKLGCTQKIRFFAEGPGSHEDFCEFKPYNCPLSPKDGCNWQNTLKQLLDHCKKAHLQQVFDNPCKYPPKWNTSNERVFLITFMDLLFLLHVKVCLQRGIIFHSVRLLGDPSPIQGLQFVFRAKRNTIEFSKKGSILPAGNLSLDEVSAMSTQIKNLFEILDNNSERSVLTIEISVVMVKCKFCKSEIEYSVSKICSKCQIKIRKCKKNSEGCTYEDVNKYKCFKHEYYYCKYRTKCSFSFCYKTFSPGDFFHHFKQSPCRSVTSSQIDSYWLAKDAVREYCILDSHIGPIFCEYFILFSVLWVFVNTSLVSYELDFYQIVADVEDITSSVKSTHIADVVYDDQFDFKLNIKLKEFLSWKGNGVKINLKLIKISDKTI